MRVYVCRHVGVILCSWCSCVYLCVYACVCVCVLQAPELVADVALDVLKLGAGGLVAGARQIGTLAGEHVPGAKQLGKVFRCVCSGTSCHTLFVACTWHLGQ